MKTKTYQYISVLLVIFITVIILTSCRNKAELIDEGVTDSIRVLSISGTRSNEHEFNNALAKEINRIEKEGWIFTSSDHGRYIFRRYRQ